MDGRHARRVRDDARRRVPTGFRPSEKRIAARARFIDGQRKVVSINLRLTLEYDGTEFSGFQWQPAVRTVAGILEAVLAKVFDQRIKVTGAGRTDRGVHASGQVVSFSTDRPFPLDRLAVALNALLPRDCSVREVATADRDFSARFSARERTYIYAVLNQAQRSALLARYAHHVAQPLDLAAMQAAAECLVGQHDFRAFGTSGPGASTVRSVRRLTIEPRGGLIRIEIAANAFLHHMVRNIVGELLDRGADRSVGSPTAPARGLWLAGVRYEDGYDSFAEPPLFGSRAAALLDGAQAFP